MKKLWPSILLGAGVTLVGLICYWLLQPYSVFARALGVALGCGVAAMIVMLLIHKNETK